MGSGNMNSILAGLIVLMSVALIEMYGKRGKYLLIETRGTDTNGLDYQSLHVHGKSRVLHHSKHASVIECHGTMKAGCKGDECSAICEDGTSVMLRASLKCPEGGFKPIEIRSKGECRQHRLTCEKFV